MNHYYYVIPQKALKSAVRGVSLMKRHDVGEHDVLSTAIATEAQLHADQVIELLDYFNNNKENKAYGLNTFEETQDAPSTGYIEWQMHGGNDGYSWAKTIVRKIEMKKKSDKGSTVVPGIKADVFEVTAESTFEVGELDVSLGAASSMISNAFLSIFDVNKEGEREWKSYVVEVFMGHPEFADSLIASFYEIGGMYLVPYEISEKSIAFAVQADWEPVRRTYELINTPEPAEPTEPVSPPAAAIPETEPNTEADEQEIIPPGQKDDKFDPPQNPGSEEDTSTTEGDGQENEGFEFSESESGSVLHLLERDEQAEIVPLELDIAIIEPGLGNSRDNNYYPKEMLEKHAEVFKGAKMYETDHRSDEKSTRTWVSTITEMNGFTESGAPIGHVVIHDKGFAERIVALDKAGIIGKMECSIFATGTSKQGEIEGEKVNIVEEITEAYSVDWVTTAGAGGRALNMAENKNVEDEIPEEENDIGESKVVLLSEQEAVDLIGKSNLPEVSKQKLLKNTYKSVKACEAAITEEREYIKIISGSGRPFAITNPSEEKTKDEEIEELQETHPVRVGDIIKKYREGG